LDDVLENPDRQDRFLALIFCYPAICAGRGASGRKRRRWT
jgi:hypothetical protein